MLRGQSASVDALSAQLRRIPEVAACWIVTGEHDFLLDVRARDMEEFSAALLNKIQKVKGVVSTVSTFVLLDL